MSRRIEFTFAGDSADLEAALRRLQREGEKTGDDIEDGGERGADGLSKAEKASKALKAALAAVAVAAAAAAAATVAVVKATLDLAARGDQVAKMAKTLNMSAEGLQVIQGALELGGVAAQSTANALHKLNINLGEAAEGVGPAHDALTKLGLSFKEIEALAPEERIALIADRLGGLESETIRASLAQDLLGRGAKEMLAAFTDGGDAIRDNMELIRRTGVLSNETAAASEALVDAQTLLTKRLGALRDDALKPLLPVLTDLADELRAVMDETDPEDVENLGEVFARILLEAMLPAAIFFGREFAKIMVSSETYVAALMVALNVLSIQFKWLKALSQLASGEGGAALETMKGAFTDVGDAMDDFSDAGADVGSTLATIDETADKLAAAVARVAAKVGTVGKEAKPAAKAVKGLADAVEELADSEKKIPEGDGFSMGGMLDQLNQDVKDAEDYEDYRQGLARKTAEKRFKYEHELHTKIQALNSERAEEDRARATEAIELVEEVASTTASILKQAADQMLEDRIDAARLTADRIEDIEDRIKNATTESEKERLIAQRDMLQARRADQKAEALEAWHISQALAVSQAIINTAAGVVAQLVAGPPAGFIMAGIAAAMGAAQVAAIAAEQPPQFHAGGMIGGQARAHDEINIRARAGEAVLSPQGVAAAGGPGGVNALNAGAGSGGPNVTVFQVGHRVVDSMVHESLRRPGGRLTRELRAVRPRRIGRYNPHRS